VAVAGLGGLWLGQLAVGEGGANARAPAAAGRSGGAASAVYFEHAATVAV